MKKNNSQYSNIRNQNKNEILEDYVEAIQEISEIKGDVKNADLSIHFGVSQATINKNLINRFDIFTISDKQTIEQFLQKTKNSNLLFSPWTSYGRTEKIEKILDNFKKLNLIN